MSLYNQIKKTYIKASPFKYTDINLDILLLLLISKKTNLLSGKDTLDGLVDLAETIKQEVPLRLLFRNVHNYISTLKLTPVNQSFITKLLEADCEGIDSLGIACRVLKHNPTQLTLTPSALVLGIKFEVLKNNPPQRCLGAYDIGLSLTKKLIAEYLDNQAVYDPFCGSGIVGIINKDSYGCDKDMIEVDIANINKYLEHGSGHKLFSHNLSTAACHDYIFTNIPFQKSAEQNEAVLNRLAGITNKKMLAILPGGSLKKMKNVTKGFKVVETFSIEAFKPSARTRLEVVLYTKH